jgi:hypothetical protein
MEAIMSARGVRRHAVRAELVELVGAIPLLN